MSKNSEKADNFIITVAAAISFMSIFSSVSTIQSIRRRQERNEKVVDTSNENISYDYSNKQLYYYDQNREIHGVKPGQFSKLLPDGKYHMVSNARAYYDDEGALHEVFALDLLEVYTKDIITYAPEGYEIKEINGDYELYKVEGDKLFKKDFYTSDYLMYTFEKDYTRDEIKEYILKSVGTDKYPFKVNVTVIKYVLPEGAYYLDEDLVNGIPTKCYMEIVHPKEEDYSMSKHK